MSAPILSSYIPDGCLSAWNTAKNTAGSQQVCAMVIGDSIAQGARANPNGVVNWYAGGWTTLLKNALATRLGGLAGEWVSTADYNIVGQIDASSVQSAWSPTAGQATWPMIGFSQARMMAIGDTLTITPIKPFMDFDLIVYQAPGYADFTLSVDGVALTASVQEIVDNNGAFNTSGSATLTCNSANSGVDTGGRHRWARYRGWNGMPLSNTTHSIVLTSSSAALMSIGGVQIYPTGRNASGLVWVRHALFGQTARNLGWGPFPSSNPNFVPPSASISDWKPAPSLVICAIGVNDSDALSYGSDMMQIALDKIVRPAQQVGASVLFVQPYWNTTTWRQNAATIKNLADSYGSGFVNFSYIFGENGNASAYTTSGSDFHPNAAGHALMATTLASVL